MPLLAFKSREMTENEERKEIQNGMQKRSLVVLDLLSLKFTVAAITYGVLGGVIEKKILNLCS